MNDKQGRGGKREGAGRPVQLENPKRFEMSFEAETLEKIDAVTDNRAAFIRGAVTDKLNALLNGVEREQFGGME